MTTTPRLPQPDEAAIALRTRLEGMIALLDRPSSADSVQTAALLRQLERDGEQVRNSAALWAEHFEAALGLDRKDD